MPSLLEKKAPAALVAGFRRILLCGMMAGGLASASGQARSAEPDLGALKRLSLEALMDLEVTSVSKRPERLLDAPAAIQVVTNEDIRRAGASNIPEALRLAGSLDVAQENAHEWAVSARGFSSDVGNKLLVLIDGRTVYTPLFSGVFWDRQDYLLEDLDRIEVISGPGGALWGANAVNGVINILTKSAHDTQGLYWEAGGGQGLRGFGGLRYGGRLAPNVSYRVYAKYFDRAGEDFTAGGSSPDAWEMGQVGFRVDADAANADRLTFQGDLYRNDAGLDTGGDARTSGLNLLGRWTRTLGDDSDVSLQVYYDRTHLVLPAPAMFFAPAGTFRDNLDTYDVDFQHRLPRVGSGRWMWGLGYRLMHDEVGNAPSLAFLPTELDQHLASAFLQDEIALREDVTLTLGTKIEHTPYTGFEAEPSVRLHWNVAPNQTLWAAVSRAVRTPARIDRDLSQPAPGNVIVILQGGKSFMSETVVAWELGCRTQLGPRTSVSVSTFFNQYRDLRSTSVSPPDPVLGLPFPFYFENNLEGETWGGELHASHQATDRWRLTASYVFLEEGLRIKPGRTDFNNTLNETSDPGQQFSLRSTLDLPGRFELTANYRWVATRPVNNAGVATAIPSYGELDARLGWRPHDRIELSLVGRNLLQDRHLEYGGPNPQRTSIKRAAYGKISWRF